MRYETLLFDLRDAIATITINRPDKLNALNDQVVDELAHAAERIASEDAIKGAILTGAGTKAFVAGADIGDLGTQGTFDGKARARRGTALRQRAREQGRAGGRAARDDRNDLAGDPVDGAAGSAAGPRGRGPGARDDARGRSVTRGQSLRPAGCDQGHEGRAHRLSRKARTP